MSILEFMELVFTDDTDTYIRCLNKASTIVYKDNSLLLADDKYIYYFGSLAGPKVYYNLYSSVEKYMVGKILYAKPSTLHYYKNHCNVLSVTPGGLYMCEWVGRNI